MAKTKQINAIILPANLSYLRSIEPTEGVMYSVAKTAATFKGLASVLAGKNDDSFVKTPVKVTETTVRGTISHDSTFTPSSRVGVSEKSLTAANIAAIEQARLAADAEYLFVDTTVRFSGHAATPGMCSEPEFPGKVAEFLTAYKDAKGFEELALRYVLNLASGAWLWRNRFGDGMQVSLAIPGINVILGDLDVDLSEGFTLNAIADGEPRNVVAQIVARVAQALAGEGSIAVKVSALVRFGAAAEVYPSQEMASDGTQRTSSKTEKILSKAMMSDGSFVATIHARKIGNAIRTIDTWHGVDNVGAIAVEVYGANTHMSQAYRAYDGKDLYSSLKDPQALKDSLESGGLTGTHHFVVACLIRGGVFGFASAAKKNKKADAPAEAPAAVAEAA